MTTIYYSPDAWHKIFTWVDKAKGEVSGFGLLKQLEDGSLYVYDSFLVKQRCTSVTTDMDQADIARITNEMLEKEKLDHMKLWWHSHVNMDVFWSGQDEKAIKNIGGDHFLLSTVFNKKREVLSRVDIFDPFQITKNDIPTEVKHHNEDELLDTFDEMVNTRKKATVIKSPGSKVTKKQRKFYNSYYDDYYDNYSGSKKIGKKRRNSKKNKKKNKKVMEDYFQGW